MSKFTNSTTAPGVTTTGITEVSFDDYPLVYCKACSRPFPAPPMAKASRFVVNYGIAGATCPQCVAIQVKTGWSFDYLRRVYKVARTIQRLFPD